MKKETCRQPFSVAIISVAIVLSGCGIDEGEAKLAFDSLFSTKNRRVSEYLNENHPQLLGLNATKQVFWLDGEFKGIIEFIATSRAGDRLVTSYDFTWQDGAWHLDDSSRPAQLFSPGTTGGPSISSFSGPAIPSVRALARTRCDHGVESVIEGCHGYKDVTLERIVQADD